MGMSQFTAEPHIVNISGNCVVNICIFSLVFAAYYYYQIHTLVPKKVSDNCKVKRQVVRTMIVLNKEIMAKYDRGVHLSNLAAEYGMAKLTMSTILKQREAIKSADVAKGVKVLTE